MPYNHKQIEQKWQQRWQDSKAFETHESPDKPKFYALDMFPYPSGAGLHVGHPKGYIATDIIARMKMMQGFNVLHPMGWDAFGLPAENFAIKNKIHPSIATTQNVETFKKQLSILGFTYDWEREVNTTDPKYYKWTQWAFLQMFKKGLAFESNEPVNWCPTCKTVLANEDLEGGNCERCGGAIEHRPLRQWVLRITDYAERLLNDLDKLPDWPESIKQMQREWIGRSEGAEVEFLLAPSAQAPRAGEGVGGEGSKLRVFTTRPDTLFGATYMVLAPEHPLVSQITTDDYRTEVEAYIAAAKAKSEIERGDDTKEKTGVFTGAYAVNPVNDEEIPIWVADYVLWGYGTGAIMAVPAHDTRDWDFATKYNIPIKQVVAPLRVDSKNPPIEGKKTVERKTIHALVRDKKTGNFLCLKWKKQPWTGFIVGGVDDGEDVVEAAKREIREETGYTDLKFLRKMDMVVRGEYFAAHKDENRVAFSSVVLFDLESEAKDDITEEEFEKHEPVWLDIKTLNHDNFTCAELELWIDWLENDEKAWVGEGVAINSDFLNGLPTWKAKADMISWLEENGLGARKIQYKLRDWVFSRQRYWGEPIPLVHCKKCGVVPIPESELPLELPPVEHYEPTDTGESPLANIVDWVNTTCPECGGPACRETNTMPQWAGSCWYYLRYCDSKNSENFFGQGLTQRPAIEPSENDQIYFSEFKKIYSELERKGIKVWTGNRLLLNGLNRELWLPLRTVCLVAWEKDIKVISEYFEAVSYKQTQNNSGNLLFEKDGVRVEIVPVYKKDDEFFSLSYQDAKQPMKITDLPESPLGFLWGFAFRTVSPSYNLAHYKYIQKNEAEYRKGLGDQDKIDFLTEWLEKNNQKLAYWNPVDLYVGGAEHATRHLIYARFWHKFLFDIGAVCCEEPFTRLQNVGLIMAEDGRKMSKRWGNVVNPNDVVEEYGADALRVYEMFMGPFNQPAAWSTNGLVGARRFLEKVSGLVSMISKTENNKATRALHQTIKKVGDDVVDFRFNTAVAQMMTFVNLVQEEKGITKDSFLKFLQVLCPFAPHLTNELAEQLGETEILETKPWPSFDPALLVADKVTIAVQVNGKLRGTIEVLPEAEEDEVKTAALGEDNVKKFIEGKEIRKVIFVKGKLLNIVAS